MNYNIQVLGKSTNVLELVPIGTSTKVASMDARNAVIASKDAKPGKDAMSDYVSSNSLAYYILLNTWGFQVSLASKEAWASLYQRIVLKGLIPCIKECNDLSDLLIHGESYDEAYTYGYLTPLIAACLPDMASLLQLLRYPKRFSPLKATRVQVESLQAFLKLNSELKVENLKYQSSWYLLPIREIISQMLNGFSVNVHDGYFSNGVAADAKRPLLAKLRMYRKYNACFSNSPLYPIADSYTVMDKWRESRKFRGFVKVVAVPKSYKAARIIAEEPAATQFNLQAIAKGMIRALDRNGYTPIIDVTDQSRNQELARLGSIDGSYATIDFSSASDSISESLAVDLLPHSVSQVCLENKQAYLEYLDSWTSSTPKSLRRLTQMWSTSGSAITFISESIIIGAFALYSTEVVGRLISETLLPPSVFGDDVVIDDRAAEFFVDLVSRIGMRVNRSKSFIGKSPCGWYRESCGVEYLNGVPTHSRYFPRRPVALTDEGLASLIDLEKRMYCDWTCRLFLIQAVKALYPGMTSSYKGESCSDLWDSIDSSKEVFLRDRDNEPIESPYAIRRRHLILVSERPQPRLSSSDEELLNMWYYHVYLLFGPLYAEPMDRLLNVSTSRIDYARDSIDSELVWRYKLI